MEKAWLNRVDELITEAGKSPRSLSVDAGLGPNFISQMFTTGREPKVSNLLAILSKLDDTNGDHHAVYVLSGIKLTPEVYRLLQIGSGLDADALDDALRFFSRLPSSTDKAEPIPDRGGQAVEI